MRRLALFLVVLVAFGQGTVVFTDSSGRRITAGDYTNNALQVNCVLGCSGGGGGGNSNITGINGVAPSVGSGATDSGTLRVVLGATQPSLAVTGTFWQATQPVSGTVTANQGGAPWSVSGSGNFTVTQGTGANLHMVCDSGCTPGGSFSDDSAFTFGTTAVNVAGYVFDDVAPNAVTENNAAAPRMSGNRVPYMILRDAAGNERGVNVTAGNALVVDGSGSTQPVSGTFWQATQPVSNAGTFATQAAQSGTWNITNISGTVSLPAGASTAAKQPALGTAGTASADVITVQGIASMTALKVDGSAVTQPISGTVTVTDGAGALNVIIDSGTTTVTQATAANLNATVIGTGTFATQATLQAGSALVGKVGLDQTTPGTTNAVSLSQINATTTATGNGVAGTGVQRVTIASDNTAFSVNATLSAETTKVIGTVNQGTSPWIVAGGGTAGSAASGVVTVQGIASMTPLFVSSSTAPVSTMNSATANAGVNMAHAAVFDDAGPTSITENSFGFVRMSANRNQYTTIRDAAGNERGANVDASGNLNVALAANQSVNVAQMNGVTITMGNGVSGTGVQRVTLASDSTGQVVLAAGTAGIGKLTANSGVDIGDVDPSTAASWGLGTTGSAAPATAQLLGQVTSGATGGLMQTPKFCDQYTSFNGTANAQVVTGVASRKVYICSVFFQMNGGANTVSVVSGTGSVCATGTTAITGMDGSTTAANGFSFTANSGIALGGGGAPIAATSNNADNVCVFVGSATRVVGGISFAII